MNLSQDKADLHNPTPPTNSQIIQMKGDGYTYAEIAAAFGVTRRSIQRRVLVHKRKLQKSNSYMKGEV